MNEREQTFVKLAARLCSAEGDLEIAAVSAKAARERFERTQREVEEAKERLDEVRRDFHSALAALRGTP